MSLSLANHSLCIQCQRYSSERRKASVRRAAKLALRKHGRAAAAREVRDGIELRDWLLEEARARAAMLRIEADDEGCDEPSCGCHARRASAMAALRSSAD